MQHEETELSFYVVAFVRPLFNKFILKLKKKSPTTQVFLSSQQGSFSNSELAPSARCETQVLRGA